MFAQQSQRVYQFSHHISSKRLFKTGPVLVTRCSIAMGQWYIFFKFQVAKIKCIYDKCSWLFSQVLPFIYNPKNILKISIEVNRIFINNLQFHLAVNNCFFLNYYVRVLKEETLYLRLLWHSWWHDCVMIIIKTTKSKSNSHLSHFRNIILQNISFCIQKFKFSKASFFPDKPHILI